MAKPCAKPTIAAINGYAMDAANLAVYIHGGAGDVVANTQYTAIPSLTIEAIPTVIRQLG
ncbi:hypothetical protein RFF05_02850 [Bengtsoniella intestinalis]|uniref:hypothetical protein n=1 Tax=Bengtsoniella intestinalis TaxID=3073143 RepID=UPI00391F4ACA